jgi:alpha-tubulin suppressor-like RCC1 family protein
LALRLDGSLIGWGGYKDDGETSVPVDSDFASVAAGAGYSLALRSDGSLVGWGSNDHGRTNVPTGNDFTAVAAGYYHSLSIRVPEPQSVLVLGGMSLGAAATCRRRLRSV